MEFTKLHWIRTRDGSPTLWHNDEGAAFRSQKGAFTESLCAFVKPALKHLCEGRDSESQTVGVEVVEFGLGPGTNWALWSLSEELLLRAKTLPISSPSNYWAIERDTESFEMGYQAWTENSELLARFVSEEWGHELSKDAVPKILESARKRLRIVSSWDALERERTIPSATETIWFHDPFGFDVNPSAYQPEQLAKVRSAMGERGRGFSYACNVPFQKALRASGFDLCTPETANSGLKRERLEFWPLVD